MCDTQTADDDVNQIFEKIDKYVSTKKEKKTTRRKMTPEHYSSCLENLRKGRMKRKKNLDEKRRLKAQAKKDKERPVQKKEEKQLLTVKEPNNDTTPVKEVKTVKTVIKKVEKIIKEEPKQQVIAKPTQRPPAITQPTILKRLSVGISNKSWWN